VIRVAMFFSPFVLIAACWALASWVGRPKVRRVSPAWLKGERQRSREPRVEVVTRGHVTHHLVIDGDVVAESDREDYVRRVRAEIVAAMRRDA
jgi:hypothetical protein